MITPTPSFLLRMTQRLLLAALLTMGLPAMGQPVAITQIDAQALSSLKGYTNFIIANDLGRNGYYDQKPIAETMGEVVALTGADFVAAPGDVHHFMGVQSVNDPLWMTNYELVYSHPELMLPWYPTLGNHEYEGNTQAVLDYSKVSRRWQMPATYYAKTLIINDTTQALLLFINTVPIIDKYRQSPEYPDAAKENMQKQLDWIDTQLRTSRAQWKIVLGHHPVYASTNKDQNEQTDLQARLQPILEKHHADFYICGHIHNFQHIRRPDSGIDYVVNTSASLSRKVIPSDQILTGSSESGFLVCSIQTARTTITLIDKAGRIVYQYHRPK